MKSKCAHPGCNNLERVRKMCSTHHRKLLGPIYSTWASMKTRCTNPNYEYFHVYGGRGIRVCDRWANSYKAFEEDMLPGWKPELQIDRIDVNGNYEPGNCRWVTRKEQARNTRTTLKLSVNGQVVPLRQVAEDKGVKPGFLAERLRLGWDHDRIVNEPTHESPTRVNSAKTHCLRGHQLSGSNLIICHPPSKGPNGSRTCRECRKRLNREYQQRRRSRSNEKV